MKIDLLEKKLRVYETTNDLRLSPNMFVIARIDGRNFSRLTRQELKLKPYDQNMANCMIETAIHVMDCGFKTIYGFTQSDEISLLLDPHNINLTFDGKIRKFISILAGEASAKFSTLLKHHASFDCRIIQLPTIDYVMDYFSWRVSDSVRNCMNAWCYYILRQEGKSPKYAQRELDNKTMSWKNEFMFKHNMNFNDLPAWQKRGFGIYWIDIEKDGYNPITKQSVKVNRKKLFANSKLPLDNEKYRQFIKGLIPKLK
jgi:tRNA(His) 5'-end guanylyltransferase